MLLSRAGRSCRRLGFSSCETGVIIAQVSLKAVEDSTSQCMWSSDPRAWPPGGAGSVAKGHQAPHLRATPGARCSWPPASIGTQLQGLVL